ncbi:LANO_0E00650g1_1 [Lachancea nothofagi CBS 11611]|uniref:LANO_0E00650g1_1 n=1 Tax=Lachancea nothofagi CBS 11611 TaxID=1266666 RepID=A0A1G4JP12_9SACH|nr:LANO_0E00650g1_1 [Lachancea nothofagi CBS 11611]
MSSNNLELMLNELQSSLNVNHQHSIELLDDLETLVVDSSAESKKTEALKSMRANFARSTMSMADLRDEHTNIIESYNTKLKLGPLADVAKSRLTVSVDSNGDPSLLLDYITEVNDSHSLHMEHVNLIGRLSSKFSDSAVSSSKDSSNTGAEFDLEKVLDAYEAENSSPQDTEQLKRRLLDWIDSLKMNKARYSLENQYILRDMLKKLTSDVMQWRQNYESVENMMFGGTQNSIVQTLQKIEKLRPSLQASASDEDVEMT